MLYGEGALAPRFAQLAAPSLEAFAFETRTYDYWDQHYGPLRHALAQVLSQPSFARLRSLRIGSRRDSLAIGIGFAAMLGGLPAIATLERIDLRGATLDAACRAELERSGLPGLLLDPS
jgi:hypothetical protein